jgi:hypothetical protein
MVAAKSISEHHPLVSEQPVAWYEADKTYVNMAGDYDYLETPYYVSQDYELNGSPIHPTCREMLDAYVPPLLLERAKLAGLPVPEYYISNGYFEPPVIIDPINPFMIKSRIVLRPGREAAIGRSMTRNHTYAICCQEIPPGSHIIRFRSILGWSANPRYREISREIWRVFHIPLARVRLMVTAKGVFLLSDISQLLPGKLNKREVAYLDGVLQWGK